jgi:hypothetical protein
VPETRIPLAEAASITASGDIWLFSGRKVADRAIRAATNSPVNHVAMALCIDDLPPLLWHAELGARVPDVWTGELQRGAQLHRLVDAVDTWVNRYGQRAVFRQLTPELTRAQEDVALGVVAQFTGRRFPRTGALARRWLLGRARRHASLEDVYCAELVALTYQRMGVLPAHRPPNWFDPGRFWSGDSLALEPGWSLGREIAVDVPARDPDAQTP